MASREQIDFAHYAVTRALSTGTLVRGPCEVCGEPRTHGHHDDYEKPLQVRWLCTRHHREIHGALIRSANGRAGSLPPNIKRLKAHLAARGSQASFARKLGCAEPLLSKWRRGEARPGVKWRLILARHGYPITGWDES